MPYRKLSELPETIRGHLPTQAQELYMAVYNRVFAKSNASSESPADIDAEITAHEAAWSAVLNEFEQDEQGRWRRHPIGDDVDKDKIPDV